MDWLVIEGVSPYDGRYPFDVGDDAELTRREWQWIKRLSGYMPLTIEEGLQGGDPDLFTVFALIALRRAGKIETADVQAVFERFLDTAAGTTIRLEPGTAAAESEENDAVDPPAGSSTGNDASSGDGSTTSSATSPGRPNHVGIPGSATSTLPPARSGR